MQRNLKVVITRMNASGAKYNTIYEAIRNEFGKRNVSYIPGISYPINEDYDKEPKYEYYDQPITIPYFASFKVCGFGIN